MKHMAMAILVGGGVLGATVGCGRDSTGPGVGGGGNGTITAKATDPAGDTYGVDPTQWDLTALTITRDTGGVTVVLDLSANVLSPVSLDDTATYAFVDFDTDQNAATGISSIVDDNRPGSGSTGMGVDYFIDLADVNADSTMSVSDASFATTGSVRAVYSGKTITVRIPRSMLGGDDGFLNAAAIVGTSSEPTDIVPEDGHLKVGGTGPVAPNRLGGSALRAGLERKRMWGTRR
jgi:hypothetical protein